MFSTKEQFHLKTEAQKTHKQHTGQYLMTAQESKELTKHKESFLGLIVASHQKCMNV